MQRTWIAFGDLRPGDRFRFVYGGGINLFPLRTSTEVFQKGKGGWFRGPSGRNYRTSKLTAVTRVIERNDR